MMKRFYVPVLESDMIFSIICEEGGLLMAALFASFTVLLHITRLR